MGGKAFKHLSCVRLTTEDYLALQEDLLEYLTPLGYSPSAIPQLGDKLTHGDLDLLVSRCPSEPLPNEVERLRNGPVTSVAIDLGDSRFFQVDLVTRRAMADSYFAWGDLGNLIGRVAAASGLSVGDAGLSFRYASGGNVGSPILLTTDWERTLGLLGYSYERWLHGFDNAEGLYEFVSSSPLFNPSYFQPESLNHHRRKRQRVRPVYVAFSERVAERSIDSPSQRISYETLCYEFPHLSVEVERRVKEEEERQWRKSVLPIELIRQALPVRQGKELGLAVGRLKTAADYVALATMTDLQKTNWIRGIIPDEKQL